MIKLCHDGVISIKCFFAGTSILILYILSDISAVLSQDDNDGFVPSNLKFRLAISATWFVALNIFVKSKLQGNDYQVGWRASLLGFIFSVSFTVFYNGPSNWRSFGIYGMFLAMFHYTEFLAIAFNNPKTLTVESFILNHSTSYHIAAVSSWIEFIVETIYFPDLKCLWILWLIGTMLCLGGEILRKVAMWQAAHNFSHIVRFEPVENHQLIKHGVYAYVRHPSYVGWFYWSLGTQIILCNPICFVLYVLASWKFFNERIFMEEITLLNFFGEEYYNYQQKVPTGLPFIRGYKLEL